jgi:hypothetical protein
MEEGRTTPRERDLGQVEQKLNRVHPIRFLKRGKKGREAYDELS